MANQLLISRDLLQRYTDGVRLLSQTLAMLSETELDRSVDHQSWTIRQIVHHIVDGDDLWKTCIKAALGSGEPFSMNWYWNNAQTNWAQTWLYAKRDIEPSLRLLQANREHIFELLNLIPDALDLVVIIRWPDGTEEQGTIRNVIEMQVAHIAGHIDEINTIKEAHRPGGMMEYCPKCQTIRNMVVTISELNETVSDEDAEQVLIDTFHCETCHSFIRSEETELSVEEGIEDA